MYISNFDNKGKVSVPVKANVLNELTNIVDKRTAVGSNPTLYFQIPNSPRRNVKETASAILEGRSERTRNMLAITEHRAVMSNVAVDASKSVGEWQAEIGAKDSQLALQAARIDELEKQTQHLKRSLAEAQNERRKLFQTNKRAKVAHVAQVVSPIPSRKTHNSDLSLEELQTITEFLSKFDGLSRFSITNERWHANSPESCKRLLGFESFVEYRLYVQSFSPDIDVTDVARFCKHDDELHIVPVHLTPFEQVTLSMLLIFSIPHQGKLASLFSIKHHLRVSEILDKWLPRWGKAGEQISILPMFESYFAAERSNDYIRQGFGNARTVKDGKDHVTGAKRNDSTMQRQQFSSKTKTTAARCITWSTQIGLVFEFTKLFLGRPTENDLAKLWGSRGKACAPLDDWKDIRKEQQEQYFALKLYSTLDEVDYRACIQPNNDESTSSSPNKSDDEMDIERHLSLLFGLQEELSNTTMSDADAEQTLTETVVPSLLDRIHNSFSLRLTSSNEKARLKQGGKKAVFADEYDDIQAEMQEVLCSGPQSSALELLCQLEVHKRLHRLYEEKDDKLRHCLLPFYLKVTASQRMDLLCHLGSHMVEEAYEIQNPLPEIHLRLAKIPKDSDILADKGFEGDDGKYPHWNTV